jgi:hypothetical protein
MRRPTPITSKVHGLLDYTTGAQLQLAPDKSLRIAGAIHAGYSVFTDYELGAVKVIPYRVHLALDALWTVGVAATPFVTGRKRWLPHVLIAAWEAASLLMSETEARSKAPERAREANEYDASQRISNGSAFDPAPTTS